MDDVRATRGDPQVFDLKTQKGDLKTMNFIDQQLEGYFCLISKLNNTNSSISLIFQSLKEIHARTSTFSAHLDHHLAGFSLVRST